MSLVGMYQIVTKMPPFCHGRELKVDDTVDNALAQIYSKGYAISDESDGGKISKCRVSIYSEARNIMLWRVVDEEKNVIDEPMPIFAIIANLRTIFYQDAETLSTGAENGRPDAYHGAALKYFCYVVCHISLYPWAAILKMSFQFFSHSSSRGVQFS